jgi:hypothetical protein
MMRFARRHSDGSKALLVLGLGVGGYFLYRFLKKDGGGHFVGADCGPSAYWDDSKQACVPLSLPAPTSSQPVRCPPGQFYDYLRGSCVSSAALPPRTGWGHHGWNPEHRGHGGGWDRHHVGDGAPLMPPTSPTVQCPPGMHWDPVHNYCLPTAPVASGDF